MSEKDMVLSLQENEEIEIIPFQIVTTITAIISAIYWSTVSTDCDKK